MINNAANAKHITVAEYAKIKGVSVQSVYKQLNNRSNEMRSKCQ